MEEPKPYEEGPPWAFEGSAVYQLHLVKADLAQAFLPNHLNLVQAFGYTLGGFFLAHYDRSPAGEFDELVVIPGIAWNPPTSCAWAGRVLVNSQEACKHGIKKVGLPSHVASFRKNHNDHTEIHVTEITDSSSVPFCSIALPFSELESKSSRSWSGPKIKMSLPSFSGKTKHNPNLLKYSCQIECRVQRVEPAKILRPIDDYQGIVSKEHSTEFSDDDGSSSGSEVRNRCIDVLMSRPIFAMKFNFLKMKVQSPSIVIPHTDKDSVGDSSC